MGAGGQRLQGRVAVVTGGAQGIGFGITSRLAEEGAILVIADIKERAADDAAARITSAGGSASAFAVDIGDDAHVAALAAHVDELHVLGIHTGAFERGLDRHRPELGCGQR